MFLKGLKIGKLIRIVNARQGVLIIFIADLLRIDIKFF